MADQTLGFRPAFFATAGAMPVRMPAMDRRHAARSFSARRVDDDLGFFRGAVVGAGLSGVIYLGAATMLVRLFG